MQKWPADVEQAFTSALGSVYKLARAAGHKKATGKSKASLQYVLPETPIEKAKPKTRVEPPKPPPVAPKIPERELSMSLDLQDTKAIAALQKQEMFWIGEHYGANVDNAIKEGVTPKLVQGLGREAAGRMVQEAVSQKLRGVYTPSGWRGTDADYFEGVAANAVTRARVEGQMESFSRVKVVTYEIVNPLDSRTTPFCADMNGTFFSVQEGMGQLAKLRGAKTPDEVKAAHPWMSHKAAQAIRGKGGSKALAKVGLALPPYHFRCRSTVDVASEAVSFSDLADD